MCAMVTSSPAEGADWPPGLPPLDAGEPLTGGFICSTTLGRLADGREVVVKRCPYPAEVEADGLTGLAAAGAPVRAHLADPRVPEPLRRRLERACAGPLPALLRPRPPASLTHGDLWSANVVEGRWLVDPAVSYADRELELAYMHLSNSLPTELLAAYEDAYPLDPGYEQRRPALQLHKFLNNIRHFGPDRYVPRIEAVLDGYGW